MSTSAYLIGAASISFSRFLRAKSVVPRAFGSRLRWAAPCCTRRPTARPQSQPQPPRYRKWHGYDTVSDLVALERGATAELEFLHDVVRTLRDRNSVVEAQRTEWRGPNQANTNRGADDILRVILQTQTGAGRCGGTSVVVDRRNTTRRIDLTREGPISRSLVV